MLSTLTNYKRPAMKLFGDIALISRMASFNSGTGAKSVKRQPRRSGKL